MNLFMKIMSELEPCGRLKRVNYDFGKLKTSFEKFNFFHKKFDKFAKFPPGTLMNKIFLKNPFSESILKSETLNFRYRLRFSAQTKNYSGCGALKRI